MDYGAGLNSTMSSTFSGRSHIIKLASNAPSLLIGDHGISDHFSEMDNLMYLSSAGNVFCRASALIYPAQAMFFAEGSSRKLMAPMAR